MKQHNRDLIENLQAQNDRFERQLDPLSNLVRFMRSDNSIHDGISVQAKARINEILVSANIPRIQWRKSTCKAFLDKLLQLVLAKFDCECVAADRRHNGIGNCVKCLAATLTEKGGEGRTLEDCKNKFGGYPVFEEGKSKQAPETLFGSDIRSMFARGGPVVSSDPRETLKVANKTIANLRDKNAALFTCVNKIKEAIEKIRGL